MQTLPLIVVVALVLVTLVLTGYAAARNKDTGDHYVAGRRIGGFANGLALAGDQISAASFLGITGAIALTGFNGFYLAVGLPIAYVLVLLLVAEPLRNLGALHARRRRRGPLRGPRAARLDRALRR